MKKKNLLMMAILAACLTLSVNISCRKTGSSSGLGEDNTVSATTLQQLKSWHTLNTSPDNSAGGKSTFGLTLQKKILQPIWDSAKYINLTGGERVICVKGPDYALVDKNLEFKRYFVFSLKDGAIADGQIVEFYSKAGILSKKQDIVNSFKSPTISGFDGAVMTYDVKYNYQSGKTYKNGKKTQAVTYVQQKQKASKQVNSIRVAGTKVLDEGESCVDWFWVTYWNGQEISAEYLYTTCPPDSGGGGNPPGGGSIPNPQDPCGIAKTLGSDSTFKSKMVELKNGTYGIHESGYYISGDTYTYVQGADHDAGLPNYQIQTGDHFTGLIHNHDSDPGMLSVFSSSDIVSMYNIVANAVGNDSFYMGLSTNSGTSYLLQISDGTKFRGYFNSATNTNAFNSLYNLYIKSTNTPAQNESNLLTLFTNLDLGLKLSRPDATFSNYNELVKNSNNQVLEIPCPTN